MAAECLWYHHNQRHFFGSSRCNFGTFAIHGKHALHRPFAPLVHHLAEPPWLHTASPVFQLPAFRKRGRPKSAKQKIMKVMTCHFGHECHFLKKLMSAPLNSTRPPGLKSLCQVISVVPATLQAGNHLCLSSKKSR